MLVIFNPNQNKTKI